MTDFSKTLKLMLEADKPTDVPDSIKPGMDYKLVKPQSDNMAAPEIADYKPSKKIDARTTGSTTKKIQQSSGRLTQVYEMLAKTMDANITDFTSKMALYPKRGAAKTGAELAPGMDDNAIDAASQQADAGIQDKLKIARSATVDPAAMTQFRSKRTRAANAAAKLAAPPEEA